MVTSSKSSTEAKNIANDFIGRFHEGLVEVEMVSTERNVISEDSHCCSKSRLANASGMTIHCKWTTNVTLTEAQNKDTRWWRDHRAQLKDEYVMNAMAIKVQLPYTQLQHIKDHCIGDRIG